jgi:hypothetical protein
VPLENQPCAKTPTSDPILRAITVATLIGLSLNFMHIDPVKALFWAAIPNGLVAAPLMAVIMCMASNGKVMGPLVIPQYLRVMGWLATSVMLCASIGVELTAKLTDPMGYLEIIIRYEHAIRRDRDNAADRLLKLQRARAKLKREHRY